MIKLVDKEGNEVKPEYATAFSAGIDLYAAEKVIIYPKKKALVGTGLYLKVDKDKITEDNFICLDIRPRSGLAFKTDLTIPNTPGTIDLDYEGEIKVIIKGGAKTTVINVGDAIAQLVPVKIARLDNSLGKGEERKDGGFGSTMNKPKPKPNNNNKKKGK